MNFATLLTEFEFLSYLKKVWIVLFYYCDAALKQNTLYNVLNKGDLN